MYVVLQLLAFLLAIFGKSCLRQLFDFELMILIVVRTCFALIHVTAFGEVYGGIGLFLVKATDCLHSPLVYWLANLADVAGKRYAEHFGLQALELLENMSHQELLRQRVRSAPRQRHIIPLRPLACKDVIIANIAVVSFLEGYDDPATG